MNLPPIAERWISAKKSKIKQYPQNNLRASSIGHSCDRHHYHAVRDWREKTLHDPIMQSIFDEGALHETDVIRQLIEVGFNIVEQQRSFQIENPLITGHIDGIIRWEGKDFPFDVKSIAGHYFDKINSAEDLLFSKKEYHRGYIAQIQLYLLMTSNEVGCFILKNKQTGEIKPIWCQIDYDYCEQILKRAERVYEALKKETPPARTESPDLCRECTFSHVCLPDLKFSQTISHIDEQELAAAMERMEQLSPIINEYAELEKQIDDTKKRVGAGEFICGDFLLRIKSYTQKRKVPLTWDEQETTVLKKQIIKLIHNRATYEQTDARIA